MITVVQKYIQSWHKRIKYPAVDSEPLHLFYKIRINKANRAHIIIKYSHFHACLYTLLQHFLDLFPGLCIFYRMVFHKNKLFSL